MKYANSRTGFTVQLDTLNEEEKRFFELAWREFRKSVPWLSFDELAFGMRSPLFARDRSYPNVLEHPLFLALKDMSTQLGIRQGMIAATGASRRKNVASRRKKARRRQATH